MTTHLQSYQENPSTQLIFDGNKTNFPCIISIKHNYVINVWISISTRKNIHLKNNFSRFQNKNTMKQYLYSKILRLRYVNTLKPNPALYLYYFLV